MTMQFETEVVNGQIPVPIQYVEKLSSPIKVIIVSLYENSENNVSVKRTADDGFGSLSKYANPELWSKEDSAWELEKKKKYDPR
jgi:lipopolysaccharide export LptBFGC system permease protein LptF